eukprot:CAMPEP_0184866368 /NCGR_PEP_ID=MMETSP0580-20130426/22085_1 /TAXON_ID=1118495 /ORGANISM="Dactyliosolen fragilissimus" /LENGTH=129 /DNA_ID=CAMNT_0027366035 /DNA_START=397 /DNA_END=782 /DNA_ORIENTATION=+
MNPFEIIRLNLLPPSKIMEVYWQSNRLTMLFNTRTYKEADDDDEESEVESVSMGTMESNSPTVDAKKYPLISSLNLPFNDENIMTSLLCEIVKYQQERCTHNIPKNAFIMTNPNAPSYSNAYVEIPNGT